MIELIVIWRLAVSIGNLAAQKGLKKLAYQIMAVALWISGEIFGFVIGSFIFGDDNRLGQYVVGLVGAAIGAGIAFLIMRLIPNPGEPDSINAAIVQDKTPRMQKFGRSGCVPALIIFLTFFCVIGPVISLRVWMSINSDSFTNAPADVEHPVTLSREGFEVQYPGNWVIDVNDQNYDPDHSFKIEHEGLGQGVVSLMIMDEPFNPVEMVHRLKNEYSNLVSGATIREFTTYGNYTGQGIELHGTMVFIDMTTRVFAFSSSTRSFVVVEMCSDEEKEIIKPGLQLIESSFRLKE